jgi:pimeloyl-ACP methyl ester carboxylesterase|nr:alpha/beta fold hydrolase [uncultured Albidiferax sp.]
MSSSTLFFATTADGVRLALRRIGPPKGSPVLLSHGSFSNHGTCLGLAMYLETMGWTAWVFDWRGRGDSATPTTVSSFDAVARWDVPCVVDAVLALSGHDRLFWVGHSGGGLVAAMWLARHPHQAQQKIAGLAMLATQATEAARHWRARTALRLFDGYLRCTSTAHGRRLRMGPENEDAAMVRQWCRWNLQQTFHGQDSFDYLRALSQLTLPVLALAGKGDRRIAPPLGCHKLMQAFGSHDRSFEICGKAQGYLEDYTHHRLILSRNARKEIWPLVALWLRERQV